MRVSIVHTQLLLFVVSEAYRISFVEILHLDGTASETRCADVAHGQNGKHISKWIRFTSLISTSKEQQNRYVDNGYHKEEPGEGFGRH